jgi:hypothetical protein
VAAALWWLFGGGFDRFLAGVADSAAGDPEGFEEIVGSILAVFIAVVVMGAIALILVMVPVAFLGGLALLSLGSYRAGRRGERAKQDRMETPGDIGPVARSVSRSTRRTLGPRLVVVRVASAIWQRAVYELAGRASIVIVDVSQPSENLVWEIESLRPSSRPRWIFIAHRPRLAALTGSYQPAGSPAARVLAAIDGCDVIAYDTDHASARRFTRALAGALTGAGRAPSWRRRSGSPTRSEAGTSAGWRRLGRCPAPLPARCHRHQPRGTRPHRRCHRKPSAATRTDRAQCHHRRKGPRLRTPVLVDSQLSRKPPPPPPSRPFRHRRRGRERMTGRPRCRAGECVRMAATRLPAAMTTTSPERPS